MLVFILTMPNVASWNGRWSGEGKLYAKCMKASKQKEIDLDGKSFYYRWDDGWGANVSIKKIDGREAGKYRKRSNGFCGYDWMIQSILIRNKILASHEIPKDENK